MLWLAGARRRRWPPPLRRHERHAAQRLFVTIKDLITGCFFLLPPCESGGVKVRRSEEQEAAGGAFKYPLPRFGAFGAQIEWKLEGKRIKVGDFWCVKLKIESFKGTCG